MDNKVPTEVTPKVDENKNEKTFPQGIIVLLVLILLGVSFIVYYYFILTPQKILTTSFNNIIKEVADFNNYIYDKASFTNVNLEGNVSIVTNAKKLMDLNGYNASYELGLDKSKKEVKFDLEANMKGNNYTSMVYLIDNDFYYNIADITNGLLKEPNEDNSKKVFNTISNLSSFKDNTKHLLETITVSLKSNINDDKMVRKIVFNEKDLLSVKTTYSIDSLEYTNIMKSIINDLLSNSESLKALDQVLMINNIEETRNKLTTYLSSINLTTSNITVTLYNDAFKGNIKKLIFKEYGKEIVCDHIKDSLECSYTNSTDKDNVKTYIADIDLVSNSFSFSNTSKDMEITFASKLSTTGYITIATSTLKFVPEPSKSESLIMKLENTYVVNGKVTSANIKDSKDKSSLSKKELLDLEQKKENLKKYYKSMFEKDIIDPLEQTCQIYGKDYHVTTSCNKSCIILESDKTKCCCK